MKFPITVFLLFFCLLSGQAQATSFSGKIVRVLDGDTVEVLHDGQAERVRLAQIDCPEKGQPFGQAAKKYVIDLSALKVVTVKVATIDRYGRTVGEIFLPNGDNLNKLIVGSGYAWQYKRYSKDIAYTDLEAKARDQKLGLWQENAPIPPWEWRKGRR